MPVNIPNLSPEGQTNLLAFALSVLQEYYFGNLRNVAGNPVDTVDVNIILHADNEQNFYDYERADLNYLTTMLLNLKLIRCYNLPPGVRRALYGKEGQAYRLTEAGEELLDQWRLKVQTECEECGLAGGDHKMDCPGVGQ